MKMVKAMRWWDWLLLVIPIVGIPLFVIMVIHRYWKRRKSSDNERESQACENVSIQRKSQDEQN